MSIVSNKKEFCSSKREQKKTKEKKLCAHSLVRKKNNKSRFYKSSRREKNELLVFYASEHPGSICIWICFFEKDGSIELMCQYKKENMQCLCYVDGLGEH